MTVSVELKPFHNSIIIKIKCVEQSDMNYYEKDKTSTSQWGSCTFGLYNSFLSNFHSIEIFIFLQRR